MKTNELPFYDMSDNPTGCCPRFKPEAWQDVQLHFQDKSFVRAETRSVMHVPVNMGKVFPRVLGKLEQDFSDRNYVVLSRDLSAWKTEHLFASDKPVDGEDMVTLSGDYITHVFEGPYRDARDWYDTMRAEAADHGANDAEIWFFFTTCPKCAKAHGKNYVVGVAQV